MAKNKKSYGIVLADGSPYRKTYANINSAKARVSYMAKYDTSFADAQIVELDITHGEPLFTVKQGKEVNGKYASYWNKFEKPTFEKISEKMRKIEKNKEIEEDLSTI